MDSSAPKRRKTSPTTNVPVDDANIPPTSNELGRPPAQRHRPSFASPTKASLARSNPDILERRSASRAPEVRPAGDGTEQTSGEAQDAQSTPADQPWSPVRRATGAMASKPRRTPNKQSAQPMLQPSAGNLELMNPFKGRALRRSPPPGEPVSEEPEVQEAEGREIHEEPQGPEAEGEAEEPEEPIQPEEQEEQEQELPPTPTQKGISDPASVNTSPMGIHNTPTKRPKNLCARSPRPAQ